MNIRPIAMTIAIGVLPSALFGILYVLVAVAGLEAAQSVLLFYGIFFMVYALPPHFLGKMLGIEVLHSETEAFFVYPKTIEAWATVIIFWTLIGVLVARLLYGRKKAPREAIK